MSHSSKFLQLVNEAKKHIKETDVQIVKQRLNDDEDFILIDVREESEFAKGHLPSAVHMGKGIIERDIEERCPKVDTDLVLYCGGGYRSALAAYALKQMGYTKVKSMDGGYRGWQKAGFETESV